MGKLKEIAAGWNRVQDDVKDSLHSNDSVWCKIKRIIGILVMLVYRLRSIFLAIPVPKKVLGMVKKAQEEHNITV